MRKYISMDLLWVLYLAFLEEKFPNCSKPEKRDFTYTLTEICSRSSAGLEQPVSTRQVVGSSPTESATDTLFHGDAHPALKPRGHRLVGPGGVG